MSNSARGARVPGSTAGVRWATRSAGHDRGNPIGVRRAADSDWLAQPADPVVAVAPGAAAAAPHRFSPDPDAVRHHPQGRDPVAYAVVAYAAAAHTGGADHYRGGGAAVESAGRNHDLECAIAAADRRRVRCRRYLGRA